MSVLEIRGRCVIHDEKGNIVLDKTNAIHPENMARSIARGLAHESNYWVQSIVYGDGGTEVVNGVRLHRTPNDGIFPDTAGWQSTIYNAIYDEVVDDHSGLVGVGDFADIKINAPVYEHDINSAGVVSLDDGFKSRVVVNTSLNYNEPTSISSGQILSQVMSGESFTFDEIALFSGLAKSLWHGYQFADISNKFDSENTGLATESVYEFDVLIGGVLTHYSITTPKTGTGTDGAISYYDLLQLLNDAFKDIVVVDVVDIKPGQIVPRDLS